MNQIDEDHRQEDQKLWAEFQQNKPAILGAVFDTLAKAMRIKPKVKLNRLPRMADFAVWGEAIYRGLKHKDGEFLVLYRDNIQGQHREVYDRATQTVEIARPNNWLLEIALDHLSLGRACLLQAHMEDTGDFSQAGDYLDQAVDGLRQAGFQHHLPRGLLARAELHRVQGAFDQAQHVLQEATSIAERGGMGLHQADCHLEYTRLCLAMGDQQQAKEHLDTAREMINNMGYHRRDRDVAQLEKGE